MNAHTLFYLIIGFYTFHFLLERWVSWLESTTLNAQMPDKLKGFYDEEKYARQQAYKKESMKFGLVTSIAGFVTTMAILWSGFIPLYDAWIGSFTQHPVVHTLLFVGVAGIAADVAGIPFDLYGTFVIEQKYGFNKTTPATFVLDKLKGYLMGAVVGGGVLALLVYLHIQMGSSFWWASFLVVAVFMVLMTMFFSHIFLPLFNKLTPLTHEGLLSEIKAYAQKVGFKIGNIFEMDGSRRSTKANAFFSGLGPAKRIVLYDTLVKDYSQEEIVAVLAHEVGHSKHKHTLTGLLIGLVQMGILFFVFGLVIDSGLLAQVLGFSQPSFHINLIVFAMLYSPVSLLTGIVMNIISRRNEYQADAYAAQTYNGKALASALKKLSTDSLANLTPHPVNVFLHYSHPPVLNRIQALENEGKA